jgi:hypothetical protein
MVMEHTSRRSSLEGISTQITLLEQSVGRADIPLIEDEEVGKLQATTREHVADAASNLMTGLRHRSEQRDYLTTYEVYERLLGAVALDAANRVYDETGDSGEVKREVFDYLKDSKRSMVALDYEKRLEKSHLERSKQWLAHHRKTRAVLPFAISVGTTSALFRASDAYSSVLDLTPTQGGLLGAMTLIGAAAIRSALRTGPTKAAAALKTQFNTSLETYTLKGAASRSNEPLALDDLPEQYAEQHLTLPFGAAAMYLVDYELKDEAGLRPMVDGLLNITEASMQESYGIKPEKVWQDPWYKRLAA